MTAAAVAAEIQRLDALSRSRALDQRESRQLERLLKVERGYKARPRTRVAVERAGRPYTVAPRDDLFTRIDAALVHLLRAGRRIRAIYLTAADMAAAQASGRVERAQILFRGKPAEGDVYAGYPVRPTRGHSSLIYDRNGVALVIRQRVAP